MLAAAIVCCSPPGALAGEVQENQPISLEAGEAKPLQHVPEDVEVFFSVNVTWLRSALITLLEQADKGGEPALKKGLEEIVVTFHKNFYQGRYEREYEGCRVALKAVQTVLAEDRQDTGSVPTADIIETAVKKAAARNPVASSACPADGQFIWQESSDELVCTVHGGLGSPMKLPLAPDTPTLKEAAAILRDSPAKYGLIMERVYLFSGGSICTEGAVLATGTFDPDRVRNYMFLSANRRGAELPRVEREAGKTIFTTATVGGEGKVVIYGRDFILGGKPQGVDELMARDFRSLAGTPDRFADVISLITNEACAFAGKLYMPSATKPAPLIVSEWPRWIRFELWNQRLELVAEFSGASAAIGLKQMLEMVKMQGSISLGMKIAELEKKPSKPAPGALAIPNPAVLKRLKETLDSMELKAEEQLLSITIPLGKLEENLRFLIKSGAAQKLKHASEIMPMPKCIPSIPGMK